MGGPDSALMHGELVEHVGLHIYSGDMSHEPKGSDRIGSLTTAEYIL